MAILRRVTIHRLRNVKPGSTFELHPGLNVLLGQNGTGKTTLLQWIADLLSGNLEAWEKEPYRVEVELETEHGRLQATVENELIELPRDREAQHDLEVLLELPDGRMPSSQLTVHIEIESDDQRYEIDGRAPYLGVRANGIALAESENGINPKQMSSFGPIAVCILSAIYQLKVNSANAQVPEGTLQRASRDLSHILNDLATAPPLHVIRRFDESLVFFNKIVEGPDAQARMRILRADSNIFPEPSLIPWEISEILVRKIRETQFNLQTFTCTSDELQGFLAVAVRLFQYRSASLHLTLLEKDVNGPESTSIYGNLRFTFERHDGSIIGHDKLSYGQKRMLSFLYYLALNPRLIVVDELVNGLHHAWIEACIEQIGDRQGLLTSQNPLLLDYLTFESADEVRRRFILCRSERDDESGREQLVWRNPTPEEAESFYRGYQAGIQHVGELLVDKGLW